MAQTIAFRTFLTPTKRVYSNPGSRMKDEYAYTVKKTGEKILQKSGEVDQYEEIQKFSEEVKIENILKRVAVGDMSDFRPQGIYQDISEMPRDLLGAQMHMNKCENDFLKLPLEVREKFNHDVRQYIASVGEKAWFENMGLINPEGTEEAKTLEVPNTKPEVPDSPEPQPSQTL